MTKQLLIVAIAAFSWQVSTARTPEPVNPPAPLPDGITAYPAQGFVNTSNTEYPSGISNIGLGFTQEVMPNTANENPARLYYQNFDVAAEETLSTSVDPLTWMTAGVVFKERVWTLPGVYKVEIPEGLFLFVDGEDADGERTGSEPVPAVTLYYEIYKGYDITPGSGNVPMLQEAVLKFTDADEVRPTERASGIDFYLDNSNNEYSYGYSIIDKDGDGVENEVVFTFGENGAGIAEPGIYGLNIPAGSFIYTTFGENYPSDPNDYTERQNQEILVKYTIPRTAQPTIDPDPDFAVKSFDSFMIYFPDGFTLFFADTMGHSPLYRVDAEGNIDTTKVYVYAKADPVEENASFVILRLYDPKTHELLESYTPPVDGEYCLSTVNSLLYGIWPAALTGGEEFTGGSDVYNYFYTVNSGSSVKELEKEKANACEGPVYNLQGIRVADSLKEQLPAGLYIAGGRKLVIK